MPIQVTHSGSRPPGCCHFPAPLAIPAPAWAMSERAIRLRDPASLCGWPSRPTGQATAGWPTNDRVANSGQLAKQRPIGQTTAARPLWRWLTPVVNGADAARQQQPGLPRKPVHLLSAKLTDRSSRMGYGRIGDRMNLPQGHWGRYRPGHSPAARGSETPCQPFRKPRTSVSLYRRCPPGVRIDESFPPRAQRVTVFGSTRSIAATSAGVRRRLSGLICVLTRGSSRTRG